MQIEEVMLHPDFQISAIKELLEKHKEHHPGVEGVQVGKFLNV
jgi:hypothetical protein